MIRTIITTHLSQDDLHEVTLLLNDRVIGAQSPMRQPNFVASGNRKVQLIATFYSSRKSEDDARFVREQLRQWEHCFRDLQTYGLNSFPDNVSHLSLVAEQLILLSDQTLMGWLDRSRGLYLHRDGRTYRVQPTLAPGYLFPDGFMAQLDFYSFVPQTDDLILLLKPDFVDLFDVAQFEGLLSDKRQLPVIMNEMVSLAKAFQVSTDDSWLGIQVQRVENYHLHHQIESNLHATRREGDGRRSASVALDLASRIRQSPVVPLREGQAFFPPQESLDGPLPNEVQVPDAGLRRRNRPVRPAKNTRLVRRGFQGPLIPAKAAPKKHQVDYSAYERRKPRTVADRLQSIESGVVKRKLGLLARRLVRSSWLVRLGLLAGILVVVVLTVALMTGGFSRQQSPDASASGVTLPPTPTPTPKGAVVPEATNLEREVEVKANSIAIRRYADQTAELIGTVTRGERVIQLSEEVKGWVYVRMQDGRSGYAYAGYLLPTPAGSPEK